MGARTKVIRTSDISNQDVPDDQIVTVLYRDAEKRFDASKEELAALKRVTNAVALEFKYNDGTSEEVLVGKAEFDKLITAEVLERADSIKGRRKGWSPSNGG